MARAEAKIKDGAAPYLQPGEEVLAAIVARPRGWTQSNASAGGGAVAGAIGGMLGGKKQEDNIAAAEDSGFEIASPMALAVTNQRVLSLGISNPVGLGIGGDVKELVSSAPLSDGRQRQGRGRVVRAGEAGRAGLAGAVQRSHGLTRAHHPPELRVEIGCRHA